jgi:inorganic pyrophosphatase
MIPQTWEDPDVDNGDNDPVDVLEISNQTFEIGEVVRVRPLGALMMIDEGELDWKIISVQESNNEYFTLSDVPGEVLSGITEWFRWYAKFKVIERDYRVVHQVVFENL